MARSGIRYEEVSDAAETLLSRGLNPTIQRVRELLGTGSNTTISEHLKSWQQQLAAAPKAVLPPTIPEAVMAALESFWKIAVQQAEAAFEEQRAAAAQAIAVAEQARNAAISLQQQAQAEAENLCSQLAAAQASARDFADRLLVEQERRAAAEAAIQAAEQRAQAMMDNITQIRIETDARVTQMDTALQQLRGDMARQQAEAQQQLKYERQRGEANEARLTQILDQNRAEQIAERQIFATERNEWKNQEIAWQTRLENQQRELADTSATLAVTEERQRGLSVELQQVRIGSQESETRYLEALRAAEALRGELKFALETQQHLQQQLAHERQTRSERKVASKSK
ncbi:MAG: DNA-binding protein [Candidatus Competibacteraceae bacterium]